MFWGLRQISYFKSSLALLKVHGVAEPSGTYPHDQEEQPSGLCILSGAGQWPGEFTFLPKEKPQVQGGSSNLTAQGCRERQVEAQDHDLLPDFGRASQLFWASGSTSVKWRDPCPSCPFSGSWEEPGEKGDPGERDLWPEGGPELGPPHIVPECWVQGGWPGRRGGVVNSEPGQTWATEAHRTGLEQSP